MVFYETFKHKFDVKKMESERLLTRVEELSHINGDLEEKILKQKNKSYKLHRDIEDLKDKIKLLKNNSCQINELQSLDEEAGNFIQPGNVKLKIHSPLGLHSHSSSDDMS